MRDIDTSTTASLRETESDQCSDRCKRTFFIRAGKNSQ